MPLDIQKILKGQKEYDREKERSIKRAEREEVRDKLGIIGKFRNNLELEVDKLKSKKIMTASERSPYN